MFENRANSFKQRMKLTQAFEEMKHWVYKVAELNEIVESSMSQRERQDAFDEMRMIRDKCAKRCVQYGFLMPDFRDKLGFKITL